MSHPIKLIYWAESPNFGDQLSPYIVKQITGMEIQHKIASISWVNLIKYVVKYPHKLKMLSQYVLPWEHHYIGLGSVLSYGNSRSEIWGSGFMNWNEDFHGGTIYALRGELSASKIGCKKCMAYGDPALLLPLLYTPRNRTKHIVGIIPHWKETSFFKRIYGDKYRLVDLRSTDVESIIDEICSCQLVLSSSLHGIIVAHAYGIPAIWIKKGDINTDGFKFDDYFSSVKIKRYPGFENFHEILSSENSIKSFFDAYVDISLPQVPIGVIQRNLLSSAPFDILEKWKIRESQL